MKKADWNEVLDAPDVKIVFDSEVFPMIRDAFGLKNLKCSYCGKRLSKRNIGGILKGTKYICRSFICMLEAKEKGDLD